jgi:hypothetical protein
MSTDQSTPERERRSKIAGLSALVAAVALLLIGVFAFGWSRGALPTAERNLARAQSDLNEAKLREKVAEGNRALINAATALQSHATTLGMVPMRWGERQINLHQQHLTRSDVNRVLATVNRAKGQLFKPVEFELAVTQQTDDLFKAPDLSTQAVLISLRGTLHFRL